MNMGITHKKVVTKPQNPAFEVSKDEWNDTHQGEAAPSATVVTEKAFGQSEAAGSAAAYSRGDHTHGTPIAYDPFARRFFYTPYGCVFPFFFTGSGAIVINQISELVLDTGWTADSYALARFMPGWDFMADLEIEATIMAIESPALTQFIGVHNLPVHDPYQDGGYYGAGIWVLPPEGEAEFGNVIAVTSNDTDRQTTVLTDTGALPYNAAFLIKITSTHIYYYINGELLATHNNTFSGVSTTVYICQSVWANVGNYGSQTFNNIRGYWDLGYWD